MNTLKLSGVTTVGGGVYENVKIDGVASINGDISCKEMDIQGVSTVNGSLNCNSLTIEGTCKVKGGIKSERCNLSGLLNIEGDLETESFTGTGSFKIGKTLNAEDVDVRFVYGSGASEVCGQDIYIRKEKSYAATEFIMDLIPWRHKGKNFQCSLIEGDMIDIECVECAAVRGKKVKIGAECKVDLVEYHDTVEVHPSAKVARSIKLGEPK